MFDFENKTTPSELMGELERFIEFWLGPRCESYGEPVENLDQLKLPEPLRRLYAFAGRWPAIDGRDAMYEKYGWVSNFAKQDMLLRPERLQWTDDSKVVFLQENQGCWLMAANAEGEDSPVWCDTQDEGIERIDQWPQISNSLAELLVTFCFQELTFGSRYGEWDTSLSRRFESEDSEKLLLWENGRYAWSECNYNFYLMDGDILVGDFQGMGSDDFFFGANSDDAIDRIELLESPIVACYLETPTRWRVDLFENGSAKVSVLTQNNSEATCTPNTFDFRSIRDELLSKVTDGGRYGEDTTAFFFREGRGYAQGQTLKDWSVVEGLFAKAFANIDREESSFAECRRTIPLRS